MSDRGVLTRSEHIYWFYLSAAMAGRVSQSSTSRIITAVIEALCDLAPRFIKFPMTLEEQARTKQEFYRLAHMPQILGCIDGTNVPHRRPPGEHPIKYLNRHGTFSINVMAVCDANLKFLDVYANFPGANQ
jgi:nuclease HARBI1